MRLVDVVSAVGALAATSVSAPLFGFTLTLALSQREREVGRGGGLALPAGFGCKQTLSAVSFLFLFDCRYVDGRAPPYDVVKLRDRGGVYVGVLIVGRADGDRGRQSHALAGAGRLNPILQGSCDVHSN